jgi:hypothetical protein
VSVKRRLKADSAYDATPHDNRLGRWACPRCLLCRRFGFLTSSSDERSGGKPTFPTCYRTEAREGLAGNFEADQGG